MYQRTLNISVSKEANNLRNGMVELLTIISIEALTPDGKWEHMRSSCSYDVVSEEYAAKFPGSIAKRALATKEAS